MQRKNNIHADDVTRKLVRVGILGSTRGSHLPFLVKAIEEGRLHAELSLVLSNREHSGILDRARDAGLPAIYLNPQDKSREDFDRMVSVCLHEHQVSCILLLGYMRILSADFVCEWQGRVLNVHPSLLPSFSGLMDLQVHEAVLAVGVQETGCTVHIVTEEVDAGPVLIQKKCPVLIEDTPQILKSRVQALEVDALIAALNRMTEKITEYAF